MRIHVVNAPKRPKPRAGDTKEVNGEKFIRRQKRSEGCLMVSNGRPVYEWVKELEQ